MIKNFLFPILILLCSIGMFGQRVVINSAEGEKVTFTLSPNLATMEVKDWQGLLNKALTAMDVDTPPNDSMETYEINDVHTDSGDMVEIIIRDKEGKVKKTIRINEDVLDDYNFDFKTGNVIRKKFEQKWIYGNKSDEPKNVEDDWFTVDLGLNGLMYKGSPSLPASLSNLELDAWKSLHVNVGIYNQKVNLYHHYLDLVWGINYDNNDYRFSNNIDFKVDSTGNAIQYPSRQLSGLVRNKLTTRFLTVPLGLRFNFNRKDNDKGHITVGVHAGYRLTSFFKTVREDEGKRKSKIKDDYLLNNFRYGAYVKVGYEKVNLFANYVATPLFRENAGPELFPFSFGLSFGGF